MTDDASPIESGGTKRTKRPWVKKRHRFVKTLLILALLLAPCVVWRARLSHEARAMLHAQSEAGRPVTLAELNAAHPGVPEQENGAPVFLEAWSLYREPSASLHENLLISGSGTFVPDEQLRPEQLDATDAWLAQNADALARLRAASQFSQSKYLSPYRPAGYNDDSRVFLLRDLAVLASTEAVSRAAHGDAKGASEALCTALAVPRSMAGEGIAVLLLQQWQMETQVLQALQFAMGRVRLSEETLESFANWFNPKRRRDEIMEMASVEQCLFLARLREGYRRGMSRNLLIASGVGDMNARVYMELMGNIFDWIDATPSTRPAIEARYGALMRDSQKRPLLYLTLNVSPPPGYWDRYRSALDEAALVRVGLALYRFHGQQGHFPEQLDTLSPGLDEDAFTVPSTGQLIEYRPEAHMAELAADSTDSDAGAGIPVERKTQRDTQSSRTGKIRFVVTAPP